MPIRFPLAAITLAALALFSVPGKAFPRSTDSVGKWVPATDSIALVTSTGTLAGTLELPSKEGRFPVALIISGSGPTDRNGNPPAALGSPNNALELLAEGLAARGVASVRFDKRGVGGSRAAATEGESALRFDTYVTDAVSWIRKLRADPRFTSVSVIGHSEGALIAMLAARKVPIDGVVSVEGAGRRAAQLLRDQLTMRMPALAQQADTFITALSAGHTIDSVPAELRILFRPSVQPYMISWFKYDPAAEIAHLTVPVLIVQGTSDIQVPPAEAQLLTHAAPKAKLLLIEGMNHVLKHVPSDDPTQVRAYTDATLPVEPTLLDGIAAFIRGIPAHTP